jgi:hypothetical protein
MGMSFEMFLNQMYDILSFSASDSVKDPYLHIISYVSTSILGQPELIHVFSGLILGFFFTKSILLILKKILKEEKSQILIATILFLLIFRSLTSLNSIRMWTGMWVFFYGTFSYASTKEKKYLIVILFSIFVHFSYLIVLIPFLVAYLLRKRTRFLTIFYLISFVLTLNFASIESLIPKTILFESQQKTYVITSEDDVDRYAERAEKYSKINQNFYVQFGEGFFKSYTIVGLSFLLLLFFNNQNADFCFNFLMSSGIGIFSFSNLVAFSPALSGRLKTIATLFILASLVHLLHTLKNYKLSERKKTVLTRFLVLFLITSVPMVLFQISYLLQMLSFYFIIFPPISWFIGDLDFSIRDGILYLFNIR